MKLSITDFSITSTTGANKQPFSGTVTFSDGKYWDWSLKAVHNEEQGKYVLTDQIQFWTRRKRMVHNETVMISSAKREKLVQEYLKRDDLPSVTVFKVTMLR